MSALSGPLSWARLFSTSPVQRPTTSRSVSGAIDRGWLLSEYGLFEDEKVIASETEEDLYRALEMQVVPPPLREGTGEVQAAAAGSLPQLIELSQIRGDLHYHSDRSGDGRSTLEEMIEAAISRGYEYVAFTDHGEDLAINGSAPGRDARAP